jgi:hypothetical protein
MKDAQMKTYIANFFSGNWAWSECVTGYAQSP